MSMYLFDSSVDSVPCLTMYVGPVHPRRKVRPRFPAQARTEGHALRSGKIGATLQRSSYDLL